MNLNSILILRIPSKPRLSVGEIEKKLQRIQKISFYLMMLTKRLPLPKFYYFLFIFFMVISCKVLQINLHRSCSASAILRKRMQFIAKKLKYLLQHHNGLYFYYDIELLFLLLIFLLH